MNEDNNERETEKTSGLGENLAGVGQTILGQIETIGGILTGNPAARAEGEFNTEVGIEHQQANKNLTAIENAEKEREDESK